VAQSNGPDDASAPRPRADLTVREYLVLTASATGLTLVESAGELGGSPESVSRSLVSAIEKLGVHSKFEAVVIALRRGLIDVPPPPGGNDTGAS
jgi:LuxR family transcriptional regulator, regulator of acetate metabolism